MCSTTGNGYISDSSSSSEYPAVIKNNVYKKLSVCPVGVGGRLLITASPDPPGRGCSGHSLLPAPVLPTVHTSITEPNTHFRSFILRVPTLSQPLVYTLGRQRLRFFSFPTCL